MKKKFRVTHDEYAGGTHGEENLFPTLTEALTFLDANRPTETVAVDLWVWHEATLDLGLWIHIPLTPEEFL